LNRITPVDTDLHIRCPSCIWPYTRRLLSGVYRFCRLAALHVAKNPIRSRFCYPATAGSTARQPCDKPKRYRELVANGFGGGARPQWYEAVSQRAKHLSGRALSDRCRRTAEFNRGVSENAQFRTGYIQGDVAETAFTRQ
jgi:hypothetical protein